MELRDDVRHTLASEFRFAADQMERAPDLSTMLFFFSAFYGAVFRALNLVWSDELALLHLVIRSAHQEMNLIAEAATRGQRFVGLPAEFPNELTKACVEIADAFESDTTEPGTIYPLLVRIAEISYATTGNGRYNYMRGNLTL